MFNFKISAMHEPHIKVRPSSFELESIILQLLDKEGVLDRIRALGPSLPNAAREKFLMQHFSSPNDSELKDFILEVTPERLMTRSLQKILPLKSSVFSEAEVQMIRKDDPFGFLRSLGLTHRLSDDRLLSIIHAGRLLPLEQNHLGAASTGKFEQKIGLSGIFCHYGLVYEHGEGDNILVFPRESIYKNKSIPLMIEASTAVVFREFNDELLTEAVQTLSKHSELPFMNDFLQKASKSEIFLLFGFFNLFHEYLITPDDFILASMNALYNRPLSVQPEIILEPQQLKPPILIISNNAQYFAQAACYYRSPFSHIPVVSNASVLRAVHEMLAHEAQLKGSIPIKVPSELIVPLFISGVIQKKIDIKRYKEKVSKIDTSLFKSPP